MNIDKYYDTIKQKLESVEPQFEENDWAEMQSFMALNTPKSMFWNRYSRLFFYSTGAILLLSSLFFNIKQNYDNKSLLKTNNILLQKINSNPSIKTKVIYRTDTVFLTKYITEVRTTEKTFLANKLENASNEPLMVNEIPVRKEAKISSENQVSEKQNQPNTLPDILKLEASGEIIEKNQFKNQNQNRVISQGIDFNNQSIVRNASTIDSTFKTGVVELGSDSKLNSLNEISSIPFNQNTYTWNRPAFEINFIPKKTVNISSQRKSINFPSISLDNLKYRVGVGFNAGSEQIGAGVINEILLNKHWSVNGGFQISAIKDRSYFTADQYLFDTKQDFRSLYASFVPQNNDIINIDFQDYLLQIPIGITYRYPLRKDFTLLFSTSTDLDIYVQQFINYDYKEDNRKFEQGVYKSKLSSHLLNNVEFSAGIEKKLNRMVFQVHPFISTQFKETVYKKEEFIFGAKLRFLVNLGK